MRFGGAAGLCAAIGTFAGWMVGADRAFGYDAALTMHRFVAVPLGRVLSDEAVWNNHPLLSLVEHAVWRATGSASETVMRVAPALFGALAVGLLTWRLTARFGGPAGLVGGAIVAVSPFAADARDVRGYSLALLAVVVMSIAVLELDSAPLFGLALFVGVGTHLHVVPAAVALVAYVVSAGRLDRRWRAASVAGFLAAGTVYVGMLDGLGRGGRVWRPTFLRDAAWYIFGESCLAVAAVGLLVVLAARSATWGRPQLTMSGVATVGVLGPWILAPTDLYPRFVFWTLPAVALAVSAAVSARPGLVVVAVIGVVAALLPQLDEWTEGPSTRDLAAAAGDGDVCLIGYPAEAVRWYLPSAPTGLQCDLGAVYQPGADAVRTEAAVDRWPFVCWSLADAELRARDPKACPAPNLDREPALSPSASAEAHDHNVEGQACRGRSSSRAKLGRAAAPAFASVKRDGHTARAWPPGRRSPMLCDA